MLNYLIGVGIPVSPHMKDRLKRQKLAEKGDLKGIIAMGDRGCHRLYRVTTSLQLRTTNIFRAILNARKALKSFAPDIGGSASIRKDKKGNYVGSFETLVGYHGAARRRIDRNIMPLSEHVLAFGSTKSLYIPPYGT